jgi:RNA polymerase sigma-70 factor (ECF subfamily)
VALADVDELYRSCFPIIRAKCRRMLSDPDEAQDVAQDTFVRLLRARPERRGPRELTAWVYRTSTHLAVDRLRQRRVRRPAEDAEIDAAVHCAPAEPAVSTRQLLERLGRQLPAAVLELLVLQRLDGLSRAEMAEVLEVSERTLRRRLQAAEELLAQLAQELSP